MKPPKKILKNYFTFDYGSRMFLLGDLHFDYAVVAGYQFYYHFNHKTFVSMNALKIYGQKLLKPKLNYMQSEVQVQLSDNFKDLNEKNLETEIPGIAGHGGNIIKAKENVFVKFGASSEAFDFGQTFVPYFDGVEEYFDVPIPLLGIGFLHSSNDTKMTLTMQAS